MKEKLENFLHRREILKGLRKAAAGGRKSLVVPFEQILKFDMELAKSLLDNPTDFLDTADATLEGITKVPGMRMRVTGLDSTVEIRNIRAGQVGKFIQVEGVLTRSGEVKPEAKVAVFKCQRCGEVIKVPQATELFREPFVCVSPDSRVLLEDGTTKTIDELRSCWRHHQVVAFDASTQEFKKSPCDGYIQLNPHTITYRLSTQTGRSIIATGDHPFWTPDGWKQLRDLKVGDGVAVHPHVEMEKESVNEFVVVNEAKISEILKEMRDLRGTSKRGQIVRDKIEEMRERGWLPLSSSNERLPTFARLLGHLFGDGFVHLNRNTDEGYGVIGFTGLREDLELIRRDLDELGVRHSKIFTHYSESEVEGRTIRGTSTNFVVSDAHLLLLMIALGAPVGVKTDKPYDIPDWLKKAPKHVKREFLAAYFGSEGSTPTLNPNKPFSFDSISLPMNKSEKLLSNARKFMSDIQALLAEFGVESRVRVGTRAFRRKDGSKTVQSILYVKNSDPNLLNFLKRVGYRYCCQREKKGTGVLAYLEYKQAMKEKLGIKKNDWKVSQQLRNLEKIVRLAGERPVNVREIGQRLGISLSSVYRLLRKSSGFGLVEAKSHDSMARITSKGSEVLNNANLGRGLRLRKASLRFLKLLAKENEISCTEISEFTGVSRKNVMRVLERLERKGLISLKRGSRGKHVIAKSAGQIPPILLTFDEWSNFQPINHGFFWDPVVSIVPVPCRDVRDLTVLKYHSFVVNDFVCHNCYNPNCGKKGPFDLVVEKSEFRDWQSLSIQEPPEKLRGGRMPRRLNGIVRDDFVDKAVPGNHVVMTGILHVFQEGSSRQRKTVFRKLLFVSHIEVLQKGVEETELTPEDEKKIEELAKDPWIRNKIIQSIAPSIYGYEAIKEAIALQLFGCNPVEMPDGTRIRGDTHILLSGDPGTAKSQLLKWVSNVAPRGLYTSGMKATGAGLTATAVRDEISGGWMLEAGALVIADGGLASVDEFEKMRPEDASAILESLEQQTISVAKAGIVATLNSRTAVLAAANPKLGRFDKNIPIGQQIAIPPVLLSRFDLIFPVRDEPQAERDRMMAHHVLQLHSAPEKVVKPPFDADFLRKVIIYARKNIDPELKDKEVMKSIEDFFVEWRKVAETGEAPLPITVRQLEGVVRLAKANARMRLSDRVTKEDANRAINLIKCSLQEAGTDMETGRVDIDVFMTGRGKSQREKVQRVLDIIKELEGQYEGAAPVQEIRRIAQSEGISSSFVDVVIDQGKRDGTLYEPKPDMISRAVRA
jgi:replicative DNA helicase Mcm